MEKIVVTGYGVKGPKSNLQVISSLLSINHGFIPPTIRTNKKGFEEMNIVTTTLFQEIKEVAVTTYGHGGNNACAYIKRYQLSGEKH
jgi:3-oxoacyl-(acyl-carrier-protein) synthase